MAVSATGELFGWGYNYYGAVGNGRTDTYQKTPVSISTGDLDWRVGAPKLSVSAGTYNVEKSVSITTVTSGATLYYTTDGTEPTTSSTQVTGNVTVDQTLTLKAIAVKAGMSDSVVTSADYTLTAKTPTTSPSAGTYTSNQNVTMSSTSQGVTIRYTTDGTIPTEASTEYTGALLVDETVVLRGVAFRTGWNPSTPSYSAYTMKVATPSISPTGGSHTGSVDVTVTGTTAGATLHYTTNGVEPTASSPTVVSGNDVTLTESGTLKVKGFGPGGWTASDLKMGTYFVSQGTLSAPTAEPAAGTFTEVQTVSLSAATPNAVIRYTTDGSEPTMSSRVFTAPFAVDWTQTVKAKAYLGDWTASTTLSAAYTINLTNTVAPVTFDIAPGRYATEQTVTLTTATSGATIHYTTNGDAPTTSDASVSSGGTFLVDESLALRAMAVKATMTDSPVRRADYQITGAVSAGYEQRRWG